MAKFFLLIALCSALFGQNIISVKIPAQSESSEFVKIPALDLKVGEDGILSREIEGNEFILANAEIVAIESGVASVKLSPFTQMSEKYLPRPKGSAREGDKLTFRILYDKALIIAPNQNAYQEVQRAHEALDFVHPDVFATFLANIGENMPSAAHFKDFCAKYDVGLVLIANDSQITTLNCASFKILASAPYNASDVSAQVPFWTRISNETMIELFSVKKLTPYFTHFDALIASKNAQ